MPEVHLHSKMFCFLRLQFNDRALLMCTKRLLLQSSAERGIFLCAHWKTNFKRWPYKHDMKLSLVQHSSYTSVMRKLEAPSTHVDWKFTLQWSRRHLTPSNWSLKINRISIDSGNFHRWEGQSHNLWIIELCLCKKKNMYIHFKIYLRGSVINLPYMFNSDGCHTIPYLYVSLWHHHHHPINNSFSCFMLFFFINYYQLQNNGISP